MNLLDKYVTEVGKRLPRKQRADIEAEIRSTLQDMLDERSAATGRPIDDALTAEVLREYGAPVKVAESYRGAQYLIGPRLYPIFELVTKIVISVLVGVTLISFGLHFASNPSGPGFANALMQFLLQLLGGLISAFGNIVIVFAILERVLPVGELDKEAEDWDPADLAAEPDPNRVNFGEQVASIIFSTLFLIIFNLYPNIIGFGFFNENSWVFIAPVLSDAFYGYLPWINAMILLQIGFSVYLLRQGWWNTGLRIANLILDLAGIALIITMLRGPALIALGAEQLAGTPLEGSAEAFTTFGNLIPPMILTIILIVSAVEVGQTVYRLLSARPAAR